MNYIEAYRNRMMEKGHTLSRFRLGDNGACYENTMNNTVVIDSNIVRNKKTINRTDQLIAEAKKLGLKIARAWGDTGTKYPDITMVVYPRSEGCVKCPKWAAEQLDAVGKW